MFSKMFKRVKNQFKGWGNIQGEQWNELFSSKTSSLVDVTSETAKRSAAVYACVRLLGGSVASLPLPIYERAPDGRKRSDNELWWLLNESPYQTLTACAFWEWMIASMLLRGDGLAQLIRDGKGNVKQIKPLRRQYVVIRRINERLAYLVNDGLSQYGLDQDDVLHFPGFGFDGVQGESVIRYAARQAVGTSLAADEFSGEFFANGAAPNFVISHPQMPDEKQRELLKKAMDERYSGSGNRHKTIVLTNGAKLEPVTLSAEDSQLLETRKFQVIEIARAFGVPPHLIGETSASTSWGSGIEQMSIGYIRYTLAPHLARIEQELNRKLWPRSLKYFAEFNRDGLLSGDSKTEADVFAKALGGAGTQGWMTVNEVRRLKNLPPIDGGEKIYFTSQVKANEPTQPADQQQNSAA